MGQLADATSIEAVYRVCAFLPALGLLAALLPDLGRPAAERAPSAAGAERAASAAGAESGAVRAAP